MTLYLETVLNVPLPQTFTYKAEDDLAEKVTVGKRVEVRFGNRRMMAFVIGISPEPPENLQVPLEKIKPILKIIDDEPVFTQEHIRMSFWMSKYYLCPQGEALSCSQLAH